MFINLNIAGTARWRMSLNMSDTQSEDASSDDDILEGKVLGRKQRKHV